ncbi:hypothetical protein PMAYCL1PPCAC_09153, partial [Pristionchus mayeri]
SQESHGYAYSYAEQTVVRHLNNKGMETDKRPIVELPKPLKMPKHELLFEEEWSKIYPGELVIKRYYFPTATNKKIDMNKIKGIYYRVQNTSDDLFRTKDWGMTLSPCWWACDFKRSLRKKKSGFYNVVIDIGSKTMKGFTTNNLHALLSILRHQCGPEVICREGFPW